MLRHLGCETVLILEESAGGDPDGQDVLWREKDGIRVVILRQPTPFKGAMLAKTVYRVRPAAGATK